MGDRGQVQTYSQLKTKKKVKELMKILKNLIIKKKCQLFSQKSTIVDV